MEAKFKRNSSRSSIRASKMPASALFAIKKRKNRYDQLESTSDQVCGVTFFLNNFLQK